MRLVLDTDVVIAGMRSPTGASAAILQFVRKGRATLVLSVALALEYEAACFQAEHRLVSSMSEEEVNIFLAAVIAMAEPVATHFLWRPQLRDAGDEMVLEAAVNGRADALVSFNVRDFGSARFGIQLLQPRQAVMRVKLS